jgi:hypothetical protein
MSTLTVPDFADVERKLHIIARELAMHIKTPEQILAIAQITADEFREYTKLPLFRTLLREHTAVWEGTLNTKQRIQAKADAMVEQALPVYFEEMVDRKGPIAARGELLKTVSKIGTVGATADEDPKGNRVVVNIDLGSTRVQIDKQMPNRQIEGELVA